MKNSQKITRVQLKINNEDEFFLFGLVCAEPDYKLSLTLNKKFRFSLKNVSPVKISDSTGKEKTFSRFSDIDSSSGTVFNLISNRSGTDFFLKNLRNVDYIFQVQDPGTEDNISQFTARLREIESVNAIFNIDLNTFKDKNLHYLTQ